MAGAAEKYEKLSAVKNGSNGVPKLFLRAAARLVRWLSLQEMLKPPIGIARFRHAAAFGSWLSAINSNPEG